jgi:hypothetical protein
MASFTQFLPPSIKKKTVTKPRDDKIIIPTSKTKTQKPNTFISQVAPNSTPTKGGSITLVTSTPASLSTNEHRTTEGTSRMSFDLAECDIIFIDDKIRKMLSSQMSSVADLQRDLCNMLWIFNNSDDPNDKIEAKTRVAILRRSIRDIEAGFNLALYITKTSELIYKYRELVSKTHSKSFVVDKSRGGNVIETKTIKTLATISSKPDEQRRIVLDYLRVAREYVDLENFNQKIAKLSCPACHGKDFEQSAEDDAIYYCCDCGTKVELLDVAPSFKDTDRVNMGSRYTYSCKGHFIDACNRFEGIQNTNIEDTLVKKLKAEMGYNHLDETTVTKDDIYSYLSEGKYSDYYEDLNLIFFYITGVEPPNITEHRPVLLEMFDKVEEVYKDVKDPDRTNSLNVNYKLYKLLQLLDYICKKDDFYILKTPTKLREHDEKWYQIIEALRKKYPNMKTPNGKPMWRHIRTL